MKEPVTANPSLVELLAARLGVPVASLGDDAGRDTLADWTSLAHIDVITAIEEAYEVQLTTREITDATTVGALRRILRERSILA